MSWFTSLKEKSLKLAQLYKSELSDFVANLNEEITGKNDDSLEQGPKFLPTQNFQPNDIECTPGSYSYRSFIEILHPFLSKEIFDDELQTQISTILSNPDEYLNKDPVQLLLPHRTDFKTFEEFQQKHYYAFTSETFDKIASSDRNLQELLNEKNAKETSGNTPCMNILQRLLYSIIYLLESKAPEQELPNPAFTGEREEDIIFSKGQEQEGAIGNAGDALEKKAELSDQFYVVEDGSSNSNGSSSNETERIESTGQRDVVSVSGSEDWQGEEKVFTMEFTG